MSSLSLVSSIMCDAVCLAVYAVVVVEAVNVGVCGFCVFPCFIFLVKHKLCSSSSPFSSSVIRIMLN